MKRSYHSDVAIRHKLGILDPVLVKQIPTSTLHNWKKKDYSTLFGCESLYERDENIEMIKEFLSKKQLLAAAKALYFVYCTFVLLFDKVRNKKKIFRQYKDIIIKTIDRIKDTIGFKRSLEAFGISYQQYYAWKRKLCAISPIHLCRKAYHNQLTGKEIKTVKKYLDKSKFFHWPVISVYYEMIRDKAAFISSTSFYKYVRIIKPLRIDNRIKKIKYAAGLRADKSKRILHMDVTVYRPLDHTRVYIYFLVDNFSRFILNWKASLSLSASITLQNIIESFKRYDLRKVIPSIDLIVDYGTENNGPVNTFTDDINNNICKLVARRDITFSNSMVEAVNKRMKYDFLFSAKLLNFECTQSFLEKAVDEYNNRPHSALFGLTPKEVFNGALPDKNMFKEAMSQARKKRKELNINNPDCLHCP